MNASADAVTDKRVEVAKAFAQQFTSFEWEYLCSYQWFLTGMDRALETGDFALLNARAKNTLVDDKIRLGNHSKKETIVFWYSKSPSPPK
jgi:hypothetical protein